DVFLMCDAGFTGGPPFSTWMVDTPSLPHGGTEAEDRHSNFYDVWVNLSPVSISLRPLRPASSR
ncbi:MAG TPA: hypothetical protein VK217_10785, partial [Acidimicrobiales bacterium]|nr:hypothetical protein [Acidimicrobiales bacterium]